jgi:predicted SprT family Zn-dependent metalloprotease
MKLKNIRGSWEHDGRHSISISRKQLALNYHYGIALMVHEFSHIIVDLEYRRKRVLPHGKEFKHTENRLLKLFGLSMKRKKAYAKIIYKDNKEVWHE